MRTPHPAIAESLSEEAQRETREAPLRARSAELEGKLATIVKWLEENQPDVFRRGLWDEISAPTAQALARLVEAAIQARPYARFTLELRDAVDAYQAARSGRGEGQT